LVAHARADRHVWRAVIPLIVNGRRVDLSIDDGGVPFVTVGEEGLRKRGWYDDEWRDVLDTT
jgi:hypothetical protein